MTRDSEGIPEWLPECERVLVGAALLAAPEDVLAASRHVEPADFHTLSYGQVWNVQVNLCRMGYEPSVVLVAAELEHTGLLDHIGGEPALVRLMDELAFIYASRTCLIAHAGLVRKEANRRRVVKDASEVVRAAYAGEPLTRVPVPLWERPEYAGDLS